MFIIPAVFDMYFIINEDASPKISNIKAPNTAVTVPKPGNVSKPFTVSKPKLSLSTDGINHEPTTVSDANNNNVEKRVYGRARANLRFSSFYIFCEDFHKQLDYLYPHESDTYRKNM